LVQSFGVGRGARISRRSVFADQSGAFAVCIMVEHLGPNIGQNKNGSVHGGIARRA
jgi:hypothetical protein